MVVLLFPLLAGVASAQTLVVFLLNNTYGVNANMFIVKADLEGFDSYNSDRGVTMSLPLIHGELYIALHKPPASQSMLEIDFMPGYQSGDDFFVPFDTSPPKGSCVQYFPTAQYNVAYVLVSASPSAEGEATVYSCTITLQ